MINFNKHPFNTLPIFGGNIFDITTEYMLYLLENLCNGYSEIIETSKKIHTSISSEEHQSTKRQLYRDYFYKTESFIDQYSRLIKCVKLSLGENVKRVQSKHKVYEKFGYAPDTNLQEKVLHGLRNTQQHFEERIQEHETKIDPFIKISYDVGRQIGSVWEIFFGNGGMRHSSKDHPNLAFHEIYMTVESYKEEKDKSLIKYSVRLSEMFSDIKNIVALIEDNLNEALKSRGTNGASVRGLSTHAYSDSIMISWDPIEEEEDKDEDNSSSK